MDFKTLVTQQLPYISSTNLAFQSLSEYLKTSIEKMQRFVSGKVTSKNFIAMPVETIVGGTNKIVTATFNSNDIYNVINGVSDTIDGVLNDIGDTITLTSDEFTDVFEDQVQSAQIQSEFIDSCLNEAEVTAQSFAAAVAAKFPAVKPTTIDQYSSFFNLGDKIQALKGFIGQIYQGSVQNQNDEYIEVVDRTEFSGVSIWNIVINDFIDTITGFFDKVWQGITDMFGFFERLWNGIVTLGKYLLSKAFRYLTSNLTAGGSKYGIIDVPIIQMKLGEVTNYSDRLTIIDSDLTNSMTEIRSLSNFLGMFRDNTDSNLAFNADYMSVQSLAASVNKFAKDNIFTPVTDPDTGEVIKYITKPFDVLLPVEAPWTFIDGFVIRFGVDNSNAFRMMVYASCAKQVLDANDDKTILNSISGAFTAVWSNILYGKFNFPCVSAIPNIPYEPQYWRACNPNYLIGSIITAATEGDNTPVDFTSHIKFLNDNDWESTATIDGIKVVDAVRWCMFTGFFAYAFLFSPAFEDSTAVIPSEDSMIINNMFGSFMAKTANSFYNMTTHETEVDLANCKLPLNWTTIYKPYLSSMITPVSIHVQSLNEQAQEVERTIVTVLIAAAAIVIAVKLAKFVKRLKINTELAQAARDSFSWEMSDSSEDRNTYISLRKKARRLERISALFGKTSTLAARSASDSIIDTVFDRTVKSSIDMNESVNSHMSASIRSIRRLITGEQ